MKKILKIKSIIGLALLTLILVSSCSIAENLFFHPDQLDYGKSPAVQGLPFEEVYFPSSDDIMLHGWFVPAKTELSAPLGTVILIHGNAANITNHWFSAHWLPEKSYNVFVFDYRGYGQSDNVSPSFKGVYEDTVNAIDYIRARADVDENKLLLFGQSLGGTNAIAAVGKGRVAGQSKDGICGMLIDSTFYSPSQIASEKIPLTGYLLSNEYSAKDHVQALSPIPLLFIHGTADSVIPYQHSEQLYEQAKEPKQIIIVPNAMHIMTLFTDSEINYKNEVLNFFEQSLQNCLD